MAVIYITQGEEAVSDRREAVISTILGSCVSVCLWDPRAGVGGMNHLLLPELASASHGLDTVGAVAMERMINRMVRLGAERAGLRAKIFGGGSMLSGLTDIGERNAAFARDYIRAEAIPCDAESTGGRQARQVRFSPSTGTARQRFVQHAPELRPVTAPKEHGVELF